MEYTSVIGFDFGLKRIGVAVGQCITRSATPLNTISANQGEPNWNEVDSVIKEWAPDALIVGLPLNMDGTEQAITQAARVFAKQLENQFKLPVILVDERLSTVTARDDIFQAGGYKKLKKTQVDCIAAVIIIETWLTDNL